MRQCIILNGPPGCGKDTLASLLAERHGFTHMAFKTALYRATATFFNVDIDAFMEQATCRRRKEMPWHPLTMYAKTGNLIRTFTPREALIHVSEDVIKPNYGNDYFGKAAAQDCLNHKAEYAVFSDGGFAEEILPLIELYDRVYILKLYREGFDFDNDSRDYITCYPNTYPIHLVEDDPLEALATIIELLDGDAAKAA